MITPTECSLSSNELEVNLVSQHITAGRTLPNYALNIVDEDLNLQPVGFPGEICIADADVAIGYLNNPEETERKFLWASFADKMYRTGDKGVLRADGTFDILGRIDGDTQIKLRGLRIELQDIEQSILTAANGQISEVVVTRGSPTILVAHAVLSSTAPTDSHEFLQTLATSLPLPQYMRPAVMLAIDRIPLTTSGKTDRKTLQTLPIRSGTSGEDKASLTSTERKLAQVWESVLPAQTQGLHTLTPASDFFHVGGNSMLLIELRNFVRREFDINLPLLRFFEHSTLSAMASAIQSASDSEEPSSIDWASETAIPSSLLITQPSPPSVNPLHHPPQTVLLTGATGFLGQHLLQSLTTNSNIKIHCLGVRDPSKLASFSHSERAVVHTGDLSLPNLGLSPDVLADLSASADAIIHNGADVSFLKTYASQRAANVDSTKIIIEMALPRKVPVHFVSTGTVGELIGGDSLAPEPLAGFSLSEGFKDGYAASKWVSEVLLERVGRELGLPVVIHRPSSITGDGAGEGDIVANVLRYADLLKAVPESRGWSGFVDLMPVEEVVEGLVRSEMERGWKRWILCIILEGKIIPAGEIGETLNEDRKWEVLEMTQWVNWAVEKGMNPLVGEFLKSADRGQGLQIWGRGSYDEWDQPGVAGVDGLYWGSLVSEQRAD